MSDAIDKYLEYRRAILDKENQESISAKKALFEESLKTCEDPLIPDEGDYSLLGYATFLGDEDSVGKILKKIGKFQQADNATLQILSDAISAIDDVPSAIKDATLRLLCDNGINVDQPEFVTFGRTMLALYSGRADLVACILLLRNSADISAINTYNKPKNIFAYAFESKLDDKETDPAEIKKFKIKKIQLINLLSLWAWSVGYKPDLSSIDLRSIDPDIIKNVFVIGAKHSGFDLALVPSLGFENAFTDMKALLEKARNDKQFNFKELYLALKHCLDAGSTNPELISAMDKVKQIWLQHLQDDNRLVLYTLFYMPKTVAALPPKLKERALQQQEELEMLSSTEVNLRT